MIKESGWMNLFSNHLNCVDNAKTKLFVTDIQVNTISYRGI